MNAICRTCLRSSDKLQSLGDQQELVHKIETIASIEVPLKKGLPSNICEECISNVKKFYNFRKVIINSNKDLEERLISIDTCKENNNVIKSNTLPATSSKLENSVYIKDERPEEPTNSNSTDEKPSTNNKISASSFEKLIIEATPDIVDSDKESIKSSNHEEDPFYRDSSDEADIKSENGDQHPDKSIERAIALLKMYRCKSCNKTFPSRFKLSNHRRTEHYPRSMCNICGAIIRSDNIRRHVQLHSENPVACKICGKVCKNSESLRGHSLIHRGEIYTCDICGKSSRLKAEYKRHLKMHENPEIGKQMCSLCGKKVKDLKKHMLSHTGERPHICTYCRKGFTSPYALKVHTRQHTNEKPYMCDYCSMAFPQKVSLVMHIKSKHKPKSEVD